MQAQPRNSPPRDWQPFLMIAPVLAIMLPFFILPMIVLLRNSFYRDDALKLMVPDWNFDNYIRILTDPFYTATFLNSLSTAFAVAIVALLIAYPFVLFMIRQSGRVLQFLLLMVYLPLIVSIIARVYGWMALTADTGLINTILLQLGIIEGPLRILFDKTGMMLGMVHRYLPMMILPLYSTLSRLDPRLLSASNSLGASRFQTLYTVILPLSIPGILVGVQLTVAVVLSDYALPSLLGTSRYVMSAPAIFNEAIAMVRWASAAAMAIGTVIAVAFVILVTSMIGRWLMPWSRAK